MPHPATQYELADLIRPFVRAKVDRKPDPDAKYGGYLPLTAAIDILHRTNSYDADVRAVTDEGVSVFFYDRCELIPWGKIRRVTVAGIDERGNRLSEIVFEPVAERELAA